MQNYSCPLTLEDEQIITLAHGSGGKLTSRLIEEIFLPAFSNEHLSMLHDGAVLNMPSNQIVFSTDSYVVQPIFFPGGDIGKLAVIGTVNDLAMCGARPYYLSCGFIIEEGFLQAHLKRVVESMKNEAAANFLRIVTGDTKVIERQAGNNIFINTSGIGICMVDYPINPRQITPGDMIILSGDIGRHGMAIMAQREGLEFSSPLISDCASLFPTIEALLSEGVIVHCLRDLTRGGLATALVELSETSKMDFLVEEESIPVCEAVYGACEILGFDPLYVANEGRFIAFVPENQATQALKIMQRFSEGEAGLIGHVLSASSSPGVALKNAFGTERYLYRLVGDQLPRIC
ncbi:MAG: hydrogenase expression/formation protein HypE [Chlamydiae bacterium]|nr:hydrogenase expression/formation protein HypE [Chlamydiota bacterium]